MNSKIKIDRKSDYCRPIAPSRRVLAPTSAANNSKSAEGAPLLF